MIALLRIALTAVLISVCWSITIGASLVQIDNSTLSAKVIFGYQGWFGCPGDQSKRGWRHWFSDSNSDAVPTVEMLPDVNDVSPKEICKTSLHSLDGSPVRLFSDENRQTVDSHFAWMEKYHLDGVALQRFGIQALAKDPREREAANAVLSNVLLAAQAHGRIFFVMYDLSGIESTDIPRLIEDWADLEREGVTASGAYLRHQGRPLLGLWGLGFANRGLEPADASALISGLKTASTLKGGVTIIGGVPSGWRTHSGDASNDQKWDNVWQMLNVVSPWSVGRYADNASADKYLNAVTLPDLQEAGRLKVDYMPVIFPGFSWSNLRNARHQGDAVRNQIPRRCGRFYWHQVANVVSSGAKMLYIAMFDEVDEGTAMFKVVPSSGSLANEIQGRHWFLSLDADGCNLPSDWYLRLGNESTKLMHHPRTTVPVFPFSVNPARSRQLSN